MQPSTQRQRENLAVDYQRVSKLSRSRMEKLSPQKKVPDFNDADRLKHRMKAEPIMEKKAIIAGEKRTTR